MHFFNSSFIINRLYIRTFKGILNYILLYYLYINKNKIIKKRDNYIFKIEKLEGYINYYFIIVFLEVKYTNIKYYFIDFKIKNIIF